mmetsp:Transcript_31513/g.104057  ORF Transcript_31513/g.104057 Transcript_31513/m.104057 type:complete len:293 (+) Transcript_31513:1393-2271(+)
MCRSRSGFDSERRSPSSRGAHRCAAIRPHSTGRRTWSREGAAREVSSSCTELLDGDYRRESEIDVAVSRLGGCTVNRSENGYQNGISCVVVGAGTLPTHDTPPAPAVGVARAHACSAPSAAAASICLAKSARPLPAATSEAVRPSSSRKAVSTPLRKSSDTAKAWPWPAAVCSAVASEALVALTTAPTERSHSITRTSPLAAHQCSAVCPMPRAVAWTTSLPAAARMDSSAGRSALLAASIQRAAASPLTPARHAAGGKRGASLPLSESESESCTGLAAREALSPPPLPPPP